VAEPLRQESPLNEKAGRRNRPDWSDRNFVFVMFGCRPAQPCWSLSGSFTGVDWAGAWVDVVADATTSLDLAVLQLQAARAELLARPITAAQAIAARRMDLLHWRLST
jgi:hypothetical protein